MVIARPVTPSMHCTKQVPHNLFISYYMLNKQLQEKDSKKICRSSISNNLIKTPKQMFGFVLNVLGEHWKLSLDFVTWRESPVSGLLDSKLKWFPDNWWIERDFLSWCNRQDGCTVFLFFCDEEHISVLVVEENDSSSFYGSASAFFFIYFDIYIIMLFTCKILTKFWPKTCLQRPRLSFQICIF